MGDYSRGGLDRGGGAIRRLEMRIFSVIKIRKDSLYLGEKPGGATPSTL